MHNIQVLGTHKEHQKDSAPGAHVPLLHSPPSAQGEPLTEKAASTQVVLSHCLGAKVVPDASQAAPSQLATHVGAIVSRDQVGTALVQLAVACTISRVAGPLLTTFCSCRWAILGKRRSESDKHTRQRYLRTPARDRLRSEGKETYKLANNAPNS